VTTFTWQGRNQVGEPLRGEVDADNAGAAAALLQAKGTILVSLTEKQSLAASAGASISQWPGLGSAPIKVEDILTFSRQMHTLQRAGVPILRALSSLQASATKASLSAMLADLRANLEQGHELGTAMKRHTHAFNGFYVAMVRVGEMSGRLTEVFDRLARHIEFELDVRSRIKQALRYPTMVLFAIAIAMLVINLFVIPTFATVFAQFKAELPPVTRLLMAISKFTVEAWPLLLAGGVGLWWSVRAWLATAPGRLIWDGLKLKLPIAGPIVLKGTLSRFARSFAIASRSGVPISRAMSVVAQTVDNAYIAQRIEQMRESIERGETVSRCAAATGIFTPVVLQMIAIGEETGDLDSLMMEVADMYERETDYAIKGLAASIEPLLLAVIGAMVLVLALGIFLPLWNLGGAAQGRGGG
jgi:MSHA biogenesis protein MshG